MEEEPLLTGSINRSSGDYGSHDSLHQHKESRSRRLSYSVTDDSEEQGMYLFSLWPETSVLGYWLTKTLFRHIFCPGWCHIHRNFLFLLSDKHAIVSLFTELLFQVTLTSNMLLLCSSMYQITEIKQMWQQLNF